MPIVNIFFGSGAWGELLLQYRSEDETKWKTAAYLKEWSSNALMCYKKTSNKYIMTKKSIRRSEIYGIDP